MEKLKEITYLRGFAILAVIMIHLTSGYLNYPSDCTTFFVFGVINRGLQFAVPLFLFLSALLLAYKHKNTDSINLPKFYLKRLSKVVLALILWSVIYIWYYKSPVNWEAIKGYLLLGNASYHLYFIPIIIQLYLFFPIFGLLNKKTKLFKNFIICITTFVLLQLAFTGIIRINLFRSYPYFYLLLLTYILPIGLGLFIGFNYEEVIKNLNVKSFLVLLVLTLIYGGLYTNSEMYNYSTYISTLFVSFYWSLASITLLNFSIFIKKDIILKEISDKSFTIYLSHPLILSLVQIWLINNPTRLSNNAFINFSLLLIAKLIIVLGTSYLIGVVVRIPKIIKNT